jgi:hypothetical protein
MTFGNQYLEEETLVRFYSFINKYYVQYMKGKVDIPSLAKNVGTVYVLSCQKCQNVNVT